VIFWWIRLEDYLERKESFSASGKPYFGQTLRDFGLWKSKVFNIDLPDHSLDLQD
jgi:hypothetical protein